MLFIYYTELGTISGCYCDSYIVYFPNRNWKNNKLATLNVIHLLHRALGKNSNCYCDSLGRYLFQTKNHHPKQQQNQFSLMLDINFQVLPWVPLIKVIYFLNSFKIL